MKADLTLFEGHKIRRIYDEKTETWYFSVVDIVQVLTQQTDFTTARKYWNKLKERLSKEGSQLVTNCHQLKMIAEDGKMRLTDTADPETLLRLIQSVPSPKAEPIKLRLAKVGYERECGKWPTRRRAWNGYGKLGNGLLVSESLLAREWSTPEEDEAWANL